MIPGITAAQESGTSGAPSSASTAVHFDGATNLRLPSFGATSDNGLMSFAGWFKTDWTVDFPVAFVIDPGNNYHPFLGSLTFAITLPNMNMAISGATTAWQNIIGSADLGHAAGSKIIKVYVSDVDGSNTFDDHGTGPVTIVFNGLDMWIGGDNDGSFFTGDMADLSIWPGISFLDTGHDIDVSTRRLFIDAGGHRVAPSVAIAALGSPAVMLSGNASNFRLNTLGTAGPLTASAGALTSTTGPA